MWEFQLLSTTRNSPQLVHHTQFCCLLSPFFKSFFLSDLIQLNYRLHQHYAVACCRWTAVSLRSTACQYARLSAARIACTSLLLLFSLLLPPGVAVEGGSRRPQQREGWGKCVWLQVAVLLCCQSSSQGISRREPSALRPQACRRPKTEIDAGPPLLRRGHDCGGGASRSLESSSSSAQPLEGSKLII